MISVIIPVYNCGKYLGKAIESVLCQTYSDREIIVIDDGSTDNTGEIARSYSEVRYFYQPHAGVSVARNRGICEARGSIIAFLDADDMFEQTKLEKQAAYLEKNPGCDLLFTEISNFTDTEKTELTERQKQLLNASVKNILPSACIRRSVFSDCGYFDTSLSYGEDTEWIQRIGFMKAGNIQTLEETLYLRRIHSANLSLTHSRCSAEEWKKILIKSKINSVVIKSGRKVSVIIPAYNAEKYLGAALDSVFRQNWLCEPEIIVINNNSTDKTADVAGRYSCILLNESRKGAAAARNKGLSAATGDFIFLLDADDYLCDNGAELLFGPMYGANRADCVLGKSLDFISGELPEAEKARLKMREGPYGGSLPGCILIRKSAFDKVGLFDTELSSGETVDWMIRLRASDCRIVQIEDVVVNRRLHLTNTGRVAAADERKNYAAILRKRMMGK